MCLHILIQICWVFSGSAANARVEISNISDAQNLQDLAAERCSMPYRAPELFNVENHSTIDERTDIWVNVVCTSNLKLCFIYFRETYTHFNFFTLFFILIIEFRVYFICNVLLQVTI